MSLRINTNVDALNAYRNLSTTQNSMSTSLQRLSSGLRINKAADDAAGLAISQGLQSQIGGITVALRNTQDGINVVQTADGALNETQSILQRMRDLAVQSSNDSNDSTSRGDIQKEVDALSSELDRIAGKTTFNNVNLLDGTFTGKQFQVGYASGDTIGVDIQADKFTAAAKTASTAFDGTKLDFATSGNDLSISFKVDSASTATTVKLNQLYSSTDAAVADLNAQTQAAGVNASWSLVGGKLTLTSGTKGTDSNVQVTAVTPGTNSYNTAGLTVDGTAITGTATKVGFTSANLGVQGAAAGKGIDMTTQANASTAIKTIDDAIQNVSTARASLGALQNRFQHTINNLSVTQQNLQASNSAITDTDMAQEMTNFTRAQVLSQAGTAMLAQANQASQSVLKLLQ